jgi:hypothetical protein
MGRTEGPTVLADATADVDMIRMAAGGPDAPVKVVDLRVADGVAARRLLLYWSHASRKQCLTAGEPRWEAGLAAYLAEALRLAAPPDGGRLGLITWKPLADTLREALEDPATHPEAAGVFAPLLRRGVRILVGHYGATRGRDDWVGADALVTFGDPGRTLRTPTRSPTPSGSIGRRSTRTSSAPNCPRLTAGSGRHGSRGV